LLLSASSGATAVSLCELGERGVGSGTEGILHACIITWGCGLRPLSGLSLPAQHISILLAGNTPFPASPHTRALCTLQAFPCSTGPGRPFGLGERCWRFRNASTLALDAPKGAYNGVCRGGSPGGNTTSAHLSLTHTHPVSLPVSLPSFCINFQHPLYNGHCAAGHAWPRHVFNRCPRADT
jgi:hypothetical protein